MPISLKPSDAKEGGLKTQNADLTWKEVLFQMFGYPNVAGQDTQTPSPALMVTYTTADGEDIVQAYSVGKAERYTIVNGGKGLEGADLNKSSNAYLLLSNLINAGYPENKIGDDITVLKGLQTHNIGLPMKGMDGQPRVDEQGRPKTLSVPSSIIKLPGEKKGAVKSTGAKAPTGNAVELAIAFLGKQIPNEGDEVTRKDLTTAVFKDLGKNPNRDAIAGAIFSPAFSAALVAAGFSVNGEVISK